jgi:hypothetical protein
MIKRNSDFWEKYFVGFLKNIIPMESFATLQRKNMRGGFGVVGTDIVNLRLSPVCGSGTDGITFE